MAAKRAPTGLGVGGRALWRAITDAHDLDVMQEALLLEARAGRRTASTSWTV